MIETSIDERRNVSESTTCPQWSGNRTCALPYALPDLDLDDDFWSITRSYAVYLKEPQVLAWARKRFGTIQFIRPPLHQAVQEKARSKQPWLCSAGLTNLTYVDRPSGCENVLWTSQASPYLTAIIVHLIGHSGGLRINQAHREDASVDKEMIDGIGEI